MLLGELARICRILGIKSASARKAECFEVAAVKGVAELPFEDLGEVVRRDSFLDPRGFEASEEEVGPVEQVTGGGDVPMPPESIGVEPPEATVPDISTAEEASKSSETTSTARKKRKRKGTSNAIDGLFRGLE